MPKAWCFSLVAPMLPDGATEAASRPEGRLAVGYDAGHLYTLAASRETSVHVSGSFCVRRLGSMKSTYISRSRPSNWDNCTLMELPSSVCIHSSPTDSTGFAF